MTYSQTVVNALHSSVVDRVDPQFAEIYTKYQGSYLRRDRCEQDLTIPQHQEFEQIK